MGLPRILKNMMLFQDGAAWVGEIKQVTLPKLARKLEDYRAGGMDMGVKLDMGGEPMEMEFSAGGPIRDVFASFGGSLVGTMLRFVGAYQDDSTNEITTVELIVRGRYQEIDQGEHKLGEGADFKGKLALAYYRAEWNGVPVIEIDPINMVFIVDGVDRQAEMRNALGI